MTAFLNVLICVFFLSVRAGWFLKWRLLHVTTVKRDSLLALAIYLAVMLAGMDFYKRVKAGEVPQIRATQCVVSEIQPDGTIRFRSFNESANDSAVPMRESRFISSDFARIERLWSGASQPLPFEVTHHASVRIRFQQKTR